VPIPSRPAITCLIVVLFFFAFSPVLQGQAAIWTQHNDNSRTGANLSETDLNTSNVNPSTFGKLFSRIVSGQVYAQPLYLPHVTINGAVHNVLFVATEANYVYAFDADDPSAKTALWTTPQLGIPTPNRSTGTPDPYLHPTIGITGTPVIDQTNGILYLVAATVDNATNPTIFEQVLHGLDIHTGLDVYVPVVINATVNGGDEDSSCNALLPGQIQFKAKQQLQRPALLLSNGIIYIGFAGHSDLCPYHGWLIGYQPSAGQLKQVAVFNSTTGSFPGAGGIWQAGQGPAADSSGNIYLLTGNGSFDYATGGPDLGNSFVKLSPGLSVLDWFTPYNWDYQLTNDLDLGAGGAVLVPGTSFVVGGGKEGILYALNTSSLGHLQPCPSGTSNCSLNHTDQTHVQVPTGIRGGPVPWTVNGNQFLYVWGVQNSLRVFKMASPISTTPVAISPPQVSAPIGELGGFLSLSADQNQSGTGIVWAAVPAGRNSAHAVVPGLLRAYDASLTPIQGQVGTINELWDSKLSGTRDDVGNFAKFVSPTVANGKVYLPSSSDYVGNPSTDLNYQPNQIVVYGKFADVSTPFFTLSATPSSRKLTSGTTTRFKVTVSSVNGFNGVITLSLNPSSVGLTLPTGVTASFNPPQLTGSGSSVLTVTTSSTIRRNTELTIVAQSGSLAQNTPICVNCTVVGDYDGDGLTDFAVARPGTSTDTFYTMQSVVRRQLSATQWGFSTDVPLFGDFDGDGKADIAVWRPSNGRWYVVRSTNGVADLTGVQWGVNGDIPEAGDYDGDGKTDFAIWRPSNGTWHVILSSTKATISRQWGLTHDVPVPGDYDGDGEADIAVWRPTNGKWYVIRSTTGVADLTGVQWGVNGDIPVPGDYDGDGKTDFAVWRPSNATWYVLLSSTNAAVSQQWGSTGDVPVPGDYNGDGKTDFAVWRPSTGSWLVINSCAQIIACKTTISQHWGQNGDVPLLKSPN
jgi:hypothetical protein